MGERRAKNPTEVEKSGRECTRKPREGSAKGIQRQGTTLGKMGAKNTSHEWTLEKGKSRER